MVFKNQNNFIKINNGTYKLIDGITLFPEIINYIDNELELIIENYFKSYFKIYSISIYRTEPTTFEPSKSFLWHIDNCPKNEIKLMIYLDDVYESTGAFSIKSRHLSDLLFKKGFYDRTKISNLNEILNEKNSTKICEGKVGTKILFQNGRCIHKATSPKHNHRDVASFVIIPSTIPWRVVYSRTMHLLSTNSGICIFSRLPEHVRL